jgi:hypothetical protein
VRSWRHRFWSPLGWSHMDSGGLGGPDDDRRIVRDDADATGTARAPVRGPGPHRTATPGHQYRGAPAVADLSDGAAPGHPGEIVRAGRRARKTVDVRVMRVPRAVRRGQSDGGEVHRQRWAPAGYAVGVVGCPGVVASVPRLRTGPVVTRVRWWLGWPLALWRRRFPGRWTAAEVQRIREQARRDAERMRDLCD